MSSELSGSCNTHSWVHLHDAVRVPYMSRACDTSTWQTIVARRLCICMLHESQVCHSCITCCFRLGVFYETLDDGLPCVCKACWLCYCHQCLVGVQAVCSKCRAAIQDTRGSLWVSLLKPVCNASWRQHILPPSGQCVRDIQ